MLLSELGTASNTDSVMREPGKHDLVQHSLDLMVYGVTMIRSERMRVEQGFALFETRGSKHPQSATPTVPGSPLCRLPRMTS